MAATTAMTVTEARKAGLVKPAPRKKKGAGRSGLGMGSVKLPVVGNMPVIGLAAGFAADRFGETVSAWIRGLAPDSPTVVAIAGAPQYAVPLVMGYLDKNPTLMAYGLGGIGSRVAAVIGG